MSRKVQHIAVQSDVMDAKHGGQKVTTMCGQRVYPMTEMGLHIPTCTPCSRRLLSDWNEVAEQEAEDRMRCRMVASLDALDALRNRAGGA